ncbi:MAG: photosystem I assembly protein Ycf4 [Leptolyngbyaceae cyanobacterium SL_1_1]|nr:photosystem I assembly protein Ycf4 [Leptolyngbyaceae cyanobacterium RM2_2_21]NJO10967.1 photosystem I assembly protein Ycf4 [Leptolyngbyaceae cyanobacterium SL_1_1]
MPMSTVSAESTCLRRHVLGARRLSNYWWATVITFGGIGFFLAGLSSYLKINLLPFAEPTDLVFIPQGIAMGFYGTAALLLATYLWLIILWDVGGGYNEFNKDTGKFTIFRWGFPGKDRRIEVSQMLESVQGVKVAIKEGLNPKRALYLRVKGKGEIPLTRVGQPLALSTIENEGAELARFLQVPLEGI